MTILQQTIPINMIKAGYFVRRLDEAKAFRVIENRGDYLSVVRDMDIRNQQEWDSNIGELRKGDFAQHKSGSRHLVTCTDGGRVSSCDCRHIFQKNLSEYIIMNPDERPLGFGR
jgi:hypothetical protein